MHALGDDGASRMTRMPFGLSLAALFFALGTTVASAALFDDDEARKRIAETNVSSSSGPRDFRAASRSR